MAVTDSTIARRLADSVCAAAADTAIDASTRHAVERVLLDSLGCGLGAVDSIPAQAARRWARLVSGENAAAILGTRERSSVLGAALANATMIRHLDMNDCDWANDPAHPSDNIGACLTVGEAQNASSLDVIKAILVAYEIDTRETADHSLPYCVAVSLVDGEYTLTQLAQSRWRAPEVQAMLRRTQCVHDPALDGGFPGNRPARVTVTTHDGRTFSQQVAFSKGDPRNPLSDEEISAKFRQLARGALTSAAQEHAIRVALNFGRHSVRDLVTACTPAR